MMLKQLTVLTALVITCLAAKPKFSDGPIPQDCLECICQVESNCSTTLCEHGSRCGYFQLTYEEWIECGRLFGSWQKCANDLRCSSNCVQLYVVLYNYRCGTHTCQHYARTFNGGPENCKDSSTLPYWRKISKCLKSQ
uniref:lysozyme n=1 Tax=Amphioctopus fangsiao TaxID=515817 RepID=A0A517FM34_AMPFA|nr:lysozyme [Amphioctopus fangsiao]